MRAVGLLSLVLLSAALLTAGPLPGVERESATRPVRTLVMILDAVPFDTVERLMASEQTLFAGFQPPRPLISSFPSSTSVAMVGLLEPFELPRSPGYEARFFDWQQRKVRGGGAISFFRIDFAWRDFFDWSRKGVVRSAFGGLRPIAASGTRVEKAVEAFLRSDRDPYFAYLETTDLAAHLKGPDSLRAVLVRLDEALRRARSEHPDFEFRTVIFSDHGVDGSEAGLVNVLPAIRTALRAGGYRKSKRLQAPLDVVLTPFGLVSSFEAYAGSSDTPGVARALAGVDGVDLCVHRDNHGYFVEGAFGQAEVVRWGGSDGRTQWGYVPGSGDPLNYASISRRLTERAGSERAPDELWLEATADHRYPDALYRIARAFDLVDNSASILCSLEPGYMYGLRKTESLAKVSGARVRWTHGALSREATLGFLLTDDERYSGGGPLRFDRALKPLTEARPKAAGGLAGVPSDGASRR